ncbi:MAG: ankyrin repeat domain-containing protein [Pseudomonadota bacterium]
MLLAVPAMAQFSEGYNFLKAVRDRDGVKVDELLQRPGSTVINSRDIKSGETAIHIVVERRDVTWLRFLLQKGGNPNIETKDGLTPLMLATNLRFVDGADVLLKRNARVDKANRSGETPLIRAVQLGDLSMVRLLLKNGADPDRVDSLAGQSARDYASNNARLATILSAIEASDKERANKGEKPAVFGPTIRQ